MAQTAESVLKDLENNKFAPLYFLQGEESFYIDRISDYIEANALQVHEKSFNQTVVYGKDVTMPQVLENARRFPMMAMRQVLIVKEAQDIKDFAKKTVQEALLQYAQKPVPTTVLVFAYKQKGLPASSPLRKGIEQLGVLVDSPKVYDNKVPAWVRNYCKQQGYPIKDKAAQLLSEHIGNDLGRISNELAKVMINYTPPIEITEAMIAKHVGISKEYNVFELQAALGARDVLKANRIIHYFAANPKNNPLIPIISMLFSYFSKVLLVHQHVGMHKEEMAKLLGVNPYFVTDYLQAAQNYPLAKTLTIMDHLHAADLQSKGIDSPMGDEQILRELVFKITH